MTARARILAGAVYLGLAILSFAGPVVAAEPPPVVVGEVGTRIARPNADLPRALRRVLESELANLALARVQGATRFVLSASLVKLDHQASAGAESVSCLVSVVVREQKSGAIRAMLEGRARAMAQGNEGESLALEAAARSAILGLGEAVRGVK